MHSATNEYVNSAATTPPFTNRYAIMSDFYTPENDIVETLTDGRTVLLASAGVPIPMHIARLRGFVKDEQAPGPSETKTELTDAERIEAARGAGDVSVTWNDKRPKGRKDN
jgi:hypothetical protein